MISHVVSSDVERIAYHLKAFVNHTGAQVVVFAAPAEEQIAKAVDFLVLRACEFGHAAEYGLVRQPVVERAHRCRHVARIIRTSEFFEKLITYIHIF